MGYVLCNGVQITFQGSCDRWGGKDISKEQLLDAVRSGLEVRVEFPISRFILVVLGTPFIPVFGLPLLFANFRQSWYAIYLKLIIFWCRRAARPEPAPSAPNPPETDELPPPQSPLPQSPPPAQPSASPTQTPLPQSPSPVQPPPPQSPSPVQPSAPPAPPAPPVQPPPSARPPSAQPSASPVQQPPQKSPQGDRVKKICEAIRLWTELGKYLYAEMSKNPSADDLIHVIEVACQKLLLPRDFAATMMSEIRDQDTVKIKLNFCLIPDTPPGMQGKCWDEMRSPDQFSQFISYECIPYVKDECLGIAEFGSTFLIEILRQIYPLIFVLLTEKPESISSVTVYSSDDKEWGRIPVEGWYEAVQCLCDSQWLRDILREDGELAEKVCKASPIRWLVQAFPTFESMKPSEADNPLDGFDFD